jgi:hypothetical protein
MTNSALPTAAPTIATTPTLLLSLGLMVDIVFQVSANSKCALFTQKMLWGVLCCWTLLAA